MPIKSWLMLLLLSAWSAYGIDLRYWIEPCTRPETACQKADVQLAEWAVEAWQAASGGKLKLEKTEQMSRANIRLHWADSEQGQYGETRPFVTDTMRGAEVFVRPELRAMFPDIMYFLGYGGDIPEYFGRYRRKLSGRADIAKNSGISPQDRTRLLRILP